MKENQHKTSRIAFALAGAAVCVVLVLLLNRPDQPGDPGSRERASVVESDGDSRNTNASATVAPAKERVPLPGGKGTETETVHVLEVAGNAGQLHRADGDPTEDLMILQDLLSHYRRIHGANPEGGLNFEIVANMAGNNKRKLAVLPPDHPSLNKEGELLDRWGTPYWFHPVSRDLMEIVSAGPDRNLWTKDDVQID